MIEFVKQIYRQIRKTYKNILRVSTKLLHPLRQYVFLKTLPYKQKRIVSRLKSKKKINVVFFVYFESAWKYESLYELMTNDERYTPSIVVVPYTYGGDEMMYQSLEKTYAYFRSKNYNVYNSHLGNNNWLDVKDKLNPDIVFFSAPYDYSFAQYLIYNYTNVLTCYVPYFFVMNNLYQSNYNTSVHNLAWKVFYETDYHLKDAQRFANNKGRNVKILGYPGLDIIYKKIKAKDKITNEKKKKVIIAPHHTIGLENDTLSYSTFIKFADYFLSLPALYFDKIHFIFKPHPLLKRKLYSHSGWGTNKTNEYYNFWETKANTELCESDYVDLFANSDGMIHDCGSFISEYLITNKPVMFMYNDESVGARMNDYGKQALLTHYKGSTESDLSKFLQEVILNEQDTMNEHRKIFVEKHFVQAGGVYSGKLIFDYINKYVN